MRTNKTVEGYVTGKSMIIILLAPINNRLYIIKK